MEKFSFHSNPKARQCQRMLKLLTIALISHASKAMLKILQARLQLYMNRELPDIQAGFKKEEKPRSNCQRPLDHQKSKESSRTFISAFLTMPKPLTVWIIIHCEKF